ncbi:hypothetical protein CR513_23283, partial [Mucuna pruriens]
MPSLHDTRAQYMGRNDERLKSTLVLKRIPNRIMAPPKNEAPTRAITIDVTNKSKDVLKTKKDMEDDDEVPIILGRSFLATEQAVTDVEKGKLTLRLGKKEVLDISDGAIKGNYLDIRKLCLEP